jgi:hypothetical protein
MCLIETEQYRGEQVVGAAKNNTANVKLRKWNSAVYLISIYENNTKNVIGEEENNPARVVRREQNKTAHVS